MAEDVDRARERVAGQRVLFIGNKTREGLRAVLESVLDVQIDWLDGTKLRRCRAAAERIGHGRYDVAFVATSFVGHDCDKILKKACRQSETEYVPVNKGGLSQVVRGLLKLGGR